MDYDYRPDIDQIRDCAYRVILDTDQAQLFRLIFVILVPQLDLEHQIFLVIRLVTGQVAVDIHFIEYLTLYLRKFDIRR